MTLLAEVYRGNAVESVHHGHLYIEDGKGREVFSIGDSDFRTFIRSAAKPFQALPFILNGGVERFGFTENEIALSCASHAGEEIHVETAASMLSKLGLKESDLQCGTHFPFDEKRSSEMIRQDEKPTQLHNNCSGKHSAMLGQALLSGSDLHGYLDFDHPIQKEILKIIALFTDTPVESIVTAVDGCSAPNYLLSMKAMARSFARLVAPPDSFSDQVKQACRIITGAMTAHPQLVAGTDRLDTILMKAVSAGTLISKIGAEGVWLCGISPNERWSDGLGISLKIEDGDDRRARPVIAIELLRLLGVIDRSLFCDLSPMPVKSRVGKSVGDVRCAVDFKF